MSSLLRPRLLLSASLLASAIVVAALQGAACMGEAPKQESDPWDGSGSASRGGADGDSGGGKPAKAPEAAPAVGDLAGGLSMLSKIGESLREPGPYEAPRRSKDFDRQKPHWSVLSLAGAVVEREAFSFTSSGGTELTALAKRLSELGADSTQLGLLLRFDGLELSYPDALELRAAVKQVRASGKRVVCYTLGTDNVEYLVMAACDKVAMAPLGELAITGPAALPVHLRPLLARLGVVADFVHVGAYKGAAEPFTHDAPTPQSREVLAQILDQHYQTMVEVISADRGLGAEQVRALIDLGVFSPEKAKAARLIDEVATFEELRAAEVRAPWQVISLDDEPQDVSPLEQMNELMRFVGVAPARRPEHPRVAVVYALGNIVDGIGEGVLGARQEIAAGALVPALRTLAEDDSVRAVVLRVDSGGGSARASELIWKEVSALAGRKPVVVSMSDLAASGGYYISCAATKIYAEPGTLTGSIGVIGGRLALGSALAQQGVRTFPVGRGKHATMMRGLEPWTPDERAVILGLMEEVYDTFLSRVARGRKLTIEQVHQVAQGRVWTGAKAKELGLVDELGGLREALAEAERLGKVASGAQLEVYPPEEPTLRDLAVSFGQVQAGALGAARALGGGAPQDGLLGLAAQVEPEVAEVARELVTRLSSFRASAVQTMTWVPPVR